MAVRTDRKRQIIEQASQLFSRDGFDLVTVKRLARAVGISEPALYRHFESKEAIYDAVLQSIEDRLNHRELFERLETEDDIEEILQQMARHILAFFATNEDTYRLLLYSALRGHEKAKHIFQIVRGSYIEFLRHKLDSLKASGVAIDKNSEITARCFIGMVFDCSLSTSLWRGFQGRTYLPEEVVANNIPIYVKGLSG